MAIRYTSEALIHLKSSPLCIRPNNLPPAEEWMGPPPENFRNSQGNKPGTDRNRHNDGSLLEQTNRRPGVDRHVSRNNANLEDIVLGPPRTMFNSAALSKTGKPFDNDKVVNDADTQSRFPFRTRNGETDNNERFRDRDRDGRNNFRRRGDGDQDSDGWSTVKPRKSFGNEGAERFHGRMGTGDRPERFGGERRPRDVEDRDNNPDRPRRNFSEFSREKEADDNDKLRKNGLTRNRSDNPWVRDNNEAPQPRERFDRSKSWRDRTDDHPDNQHDRPRERPYERRWDRDRDQRQEREPEWLDEPDEQSQAHTQEDFKKFMETMKGKTSSKVEATPTLAMDVLKPQEKIDVDATKSKSVKSTPAIELGPDKFFAAFAHNATVEGNNIEVVKENAAPAAKPKSGSRFQTFFSSQEQARHQPEPPTPMTAPPAAAESNPLLALMGSPKPGTQQDAAEKVAFQALLLKLQKQTLQASTPPSVGFSEPPPNHDFGSKNVMTSPGPFQPYGQERREESIARAPLQVQEIHAPRPQQNAQFTVMRPEQQILHDLIGQRHPSQNSAGSRAEQPSSRNSNPNTEFLVSLMQGGRNASEPQRNEQLIMRMPQPSRPAQIPPTPDREPDFQHERGSSQHQAGVRPSGLLGFFDEPGLHRREQEARPQQPTHILQRPGQGPPGLDQMPPSNWMQTSGQQLPTSGRPMIPPPGLPGNQRAGPLPGSYPNFPMGGFPPPDGMAGPPPRNMAPPPGFFGGPPPGFIPHPGMGGFQGPEALAFGFDGRGMPPPGSGAPFRRN
ncbi:hypothetical protein F5Y19DRAFT_454136 [Xylariaceae sp. FL1651]|nr:hypothetical protein F5Y19DRAFT_454136 [Xylariaceae sp. FL1651]